MKVFNYIEELDAFQVTPSFLDACETLGIVEWGIGPIFIGRYLCMDNDYGEHFSDNWEERKEVWKKVEALGIQDQFPHGEEELFVISDRFTDGKDGPCHTKEQRKQFWTDLFKSLDLSLDFLIQEAEAEQAERIKTKWERPIKDFEQRVAEVRKKYGS